MRFIEAAAADRDYGRVRYDTGLDYRGGDWPPPPRPNASLRLLTDAVEDIALAVTKAIQQSLMVEASNPAARSGPQTT